MAKVQLRYLSPLIGEGGGREAGWGWWGFPTLYLLCWLFKFNELFFLYCVCLFLMKFFWHIHVWLWSIFNFDFASFSLSSCVAYFFRQSFKFFCNFAEPDAIDFSFAISKLTFWFFKCSYSFSFSNNFRETCLVTSWFHVF